MSFTSNSNNSPSLFREVGVEGDSDSGGVMGNQSEEGDKGNFGGQGLVASP